MASKIQAGAIKTIKFIDGVNSFLGQKIAWLNLITVTTFFLVTFLRYAFSYGSITLQETAMYSHIIVFVFASAWVLKLDEHVRVDVLYKKFTFKAKAFLNALGALFFVIPVSLFIFFMSLEYVDLAWQIKEGSPDVGGLPFYYLLKTCIPVMFALLFFQGIAEFLRNSIYLLTDKTYGDF